MLDSSSARFIAERFSLGDGAVLTGPVARGELGQVWRLSTSNGTWAVKESFEPKSETDAREEAEIQDVARQAGIPVPAVVRTSDAAASLVVGDDRICVFEWVDVLERDPRLDPDDVGRLVASIHRVPFPEFRGEDPWYREPIAGPRWDELVRDLRSAGAPFADELASYREELAALASLVVPPTVLQTCHRDLWADNLRATPDGTLCVLDWENSGLADPAQEVCLVLFEFGVDDADRTQAIYEAYLGAGGPGRVTGRGTFSMLIAQLGHIGEAGCMRWLTGAPSSSDREHAAAWVGEFLSQPLTRGAIDRILDTIGSS